MIHLVQAREAITGFIALGGPVVALILLLSVLAGGVAIWKVGQFAALGVGRHGGLLAAIAASDAGERPRALALAEAAPSHLGPLLVQALHPGKAEAAPRDRLYALAQDHIARLETGFRLLDTIAQVAPLLGLFGTVLGMIDAFRAMQEAGQSVDPSVLAGGIWVALMTTAAGLAVAMPVSAVLTWFEVRVAGERRMAESVIEAALCPGLPSAAPLPQGRLAHA
ncbi:MAG: MotA/TolQ/ExbB proton channel family protein [Paracoccaceae bacterium]|nr:MAG: MotA/TolQ/ExbB proton channel family protein [Paracoccaceae bacterium]